ncbi:hypothetical protein ACFQJ7_05600 [Halovenus rubra]|uniref:Uncharacterized protein n=2 Tax=Halovenus rubra TaxID=869890 RepID=A0ACC7DWV2_9EURY|nr:hypothetical protein [Halovenus rubra]
MSENTPKTVSENRDADTFQYTLVVEITRAAFALGISGVVMTFLLFGLSLVETEKIEPIMPVFFFLCLLFPIVLYLYDRNHSRDLVIADFVLRIVRPLAVVYRLVIGP